MPSATRVPPINVISGIVKAFVSYHYSGIDWALCEARMSIAGVNGPGTNIAHG